MLTLALLPSEVLASITSLLSAQDVLCRLIQTGDVTLAAKLRTRGITSLHITSHNLSSGLLKLIASLRLTSVVVEADFGVSALKSLIMSLPTSILKLKVVCKAERTLLVTEKADLARAFAPTASPPYRCWMVKDNFPNLKELQIGDAHSGLRAHDASFLVEFFRGLPDSLTSLSLAPASILPDGCWNALPPHLTSLGTVCGRFPFNQRLLDSLVHLDLIMSEDQLEGDDSDPHEWLPIYRSEKNEQDLSNFGQLSFPPHLTQLTLRSSRDLDLSRVPSLPPALTTLLWEMTELSISSIHPILTLMPSSIEHIKIYGLRLDSSVPYVDSAHRPSLLERASTFSVRFENYPKDALLVDRLVEDIANTMPNLSNIKLSQIGTIGLSNRHISKLNPLTMRVLNTSFALEVFDAAQGVFPLKVLLPSLTSLTIRNNDYSITKSLFSALPSSVTYLKLSAKISSRIVYEQLPPTKISTLRCRLLVDDYEFVRALIERGRKPLAGNGSTTSSELELHVDPSSTGSFYRFGRSSPLCNDASQLWLEECVDGSNDNWDNLLEWSLDMVLPPTALRWSLNQIPTLAFDTLFPPGVRLILVELILRTHVAPGWQLELLVNLKTLHIRPPAKIDIACTSGCPPSLTALHADVVPDSFLPLPTSITSLHCATFPHSLALPHLQELECEHSYYGKSDLKSLSQLLLPTITALDLRHGGKWDFDRLIELVSPACPLLRLLVTSRETPVSSTSAINLLKRASPDLKLRTVGPTTLDNIDVIATHAEIPLGSILLEPGERLIDRLSRLVSKAFPRWITDIFCLSLALNNASWQAFAPFLSPSNLRLELNASTSTLSDFGRLPASLTELVLDLILQDCSLDLPETLRSFTYQGFKMPESLITSLPRGLTHLNLRYFRLDSVETAQRFPPNITSLVLSATLRSLEAVAALPSSLTILNLDYTSLNVALIRSLPPRIRYLRASSHEELAPLLAERGISTFHTFGIQI